MIRFIYKKLKPDIFYQFNWDVDLNTPVEDACFVVFDTETTGLDIKKDVPISIGAFKIEKLRIEMWKSFSRVIKTDRIFEESIKVHGITPMDLSNAEEPVKVCREFLEYSKGCVLAGFFLTLDVSMVRKLVVKECKGVFLPYGIDLLDLLEERFVGKDLMQVLKAHGISPLGRLHNALEDAYLTALLFLIYLKRYARKKLKDLPIKVF
ncbi:3'-5' exonuclease [Thermocrinis minervae]|uniref:DNA polymerase-3 subunit epsilon n=1 Tax=Thermocrinis minervae TaxID=381751 RepID=A0A1M6QCR9_9AQUI|nr:3'-5' exonuclease [Thermocrinis minervae]SHK17863.1 DNA polymerase-3 subunit epsilon [Thermocrinis minervae]